MGVKISELNEALSVQNSDVLPIVQEGETKKIPVETLGSQKVNKTGDTLTGELLFENKDVYNAIRKTRTFNDEDYQVSVGVGGNMSARMEFVKVPNNVLSSVEARSDGIYNGVSGKKLAEQSTGWTNATLSSYITGTVKYTRIGNIVIVNFFDVQVKSNLSHTVVLASGLPNATTYIISVLTGFDRPNQPLRVAINEQGQIVDHYATVPTGTGNYYGTLIYVTNQ